MSSSESLLFTTFATRNHKDWGWCWTQLKGMEDLAAFNAREVERREREEYSSAEG